MCRIYNEFNEYSMLIIFVSIYRYFYTCRRCIQFLCMMMMMMFQEDHIKYKNVEQ